MKEKISFFSNINLIRWILDFWKWSVLEVSKLCIHFPGMLTGVRIFHPNPQVENDSASVSWTKNIDTFFWRALSMQIWSEEVETFRSRNFSMGKKWNICMGKKVVLPQLTFLQPFHLDPAKQKKDGIGYHVT